ncbi:MAG: hypothetical protein IJT37_02295 [Lachnospiraceae bacterium]|nr:hypothetical protein [Lachnospiraceae bacterium]
MKAKKIIAIGLVATMTLGMSTSVLATTEFDNYDNEPGFENWDSEFGPYDNAYNAKGQGWLEGGTGINESYANVIVPTTPAVDLKRGEPGLFDFGFDPQRLVKRTEAAKYKDKNTFTNDALNKGVYFVNPPEGEEELNKYDNKSVRYTATNIGTVPLALTIKASLSGGNSFTYLEKAPAEAPVAALDWFMDLYNGAVGSTWKEAQDQDANKNEVAFGNAIKDADSLDVCFSDDQKKQIKEFLSCTFVKPQFEDATGASLINSVLDDVSDLDFNAEEDTAVLYFKGQFNEWTTKVDADASAPVNEDAVGMYMGLNVATGVENGEYSASVETPFKAVEDTAGDGEVPEENNAIKIDASATFTQVVEGNPDNYAIIWDTGSKTYRYAMKPSEGEGARTEPFKTVAFWFRGIATENDMIPDELAVPALDFTWSFSQTIPEAPKLVSVNSEAVTEIPQQFTVDSCVDGKIVLAFNTNVTSVECADTSDAETWSAIDSQYFAIEGKELTINEAFFDYIMGSAKYLKVNFAGTTSTCIYKFVDDRQ